jgi:hypothetical protein
MYSRIITEAPLAAYLRTKGFPETSRPKLIKNTVSLFFEDSPKLQEEIEIFFNREGVVEPLALIEALSVLRALIGDIKRNRRVNIGGDSNE